MRSGWVNDIHTNGQVNGAHEVYLPTAALTTNAAGKADGTFNFRARS